MKKFLINSIKFYKDSISPWVTSKGINCKFEPTCSEYMKLAIEKYGVVKGTTLGTKRLLRCNPFSKGGYDPIK